MGRVRMATRIKRATAKATRERRVTRTSRTRTRARRLRSAARRGRGGRGRPRTSPSPSRGIKSPRRAEPAATPGNEREVPDPILIGKELASELGFHVGSKAQLITPVGRMTPAGRVPGVMKVTVGGVFYSKMYEYDKKLVYAPLETVQSFLRLGGRVSGVEVRLHDVDALEEGREAIEAALVAAGRDDLQVEINAEANRLEQRGVESEGAAG